LKFFKTVGEKNGAGLTITQTSGVYQEKQTSINIVRKGGYQVKNEGDVLSNHNEEKDAIESLVNYQLNNPDKVYYIAPYDKIICDID